jgi:hypothetical protein
MLPAHQGAADSHLENVQLLSLRMSAVKDVGSATLSPTTMPSTVKRETRMPTETAKQPRPNLLLPRPLHNQRQRQVTLPQRPQELNSSLALAPRTPIALLDVVGSIRESVRVSTEDLQIMYAVSDQCVGPVIAQERDGGCGFGDAQPNDNAAQALQGKRLGRRGPVLM